MADQRPKLLSTIKKYGNRLFGFIRGRVSSHEDAEDILQEVWFQLSRIVDLEEIENINAWLFRVARSKIIDQYRKRSDELYEDSLFSDDAGAEIKDILFGATTSLEEELFQNLFWEELMTALDELPQEQKDVFVRNELEGITLREISEKSDTSIKTVISRKQYAVRHLRKRLRSLYDDL